MTGISKLAELLVSTGKLAKGSARALVETILRLSGERADELADASAEDATIPLDDPLPFDEQPEPEAESDPYERFNRTFFDEPIRSTEPKRTAYAAKTAAVNDRIAELRRLAYKRENRNRSPEEIFCIQAEYAKDIEDDYAYSQAARFDSSNRELGRYFSGFSGMSVHSLRSYFTWRTKLRRGELGYGSLVFAFLYATELINLIGVASPEEGFRQLRDFMTDYAKFDHRIAPFIERWLRAMAVCYGLPAEFYPPEKSAGNEPKYELLEHPDQADDESLFAALDQLSSYKLFASRAYKLLEDDFRKVVTRVFRRVHESMEQAAFTERFIGKASVVSYDLFSPALFCERNESDRVYEASGHCRYIRRNGKWYKEKLTRSAEQSAALGALLKNTDHLMRKCFNVRSTLKAEPVSEAEEKLISGVILQYLKEKREAERPRIEIDFSKLSSIRSSSLETQNMLLVSDTDGENTPDDDKPEDRQPCAERPETDRDEPPAESGPPAAAPADTLGYGLTAAEKRLLELLLEGRPYEKEMLAIGVLPSVAADGVNEKLFDLLSDTAITERGGGLELLSDYKDEVKGILGRA